MCSFENYQFQKYLNNFEQSKFFKKINHAQDDKMKDAARKNSSENDEWLLYND